MHLKQLEAKKQRLVEQLAAKRRWRALSRRNNSPVPVKFVVQENPEEGSNRTMSDTLGTPEKELNAAQAQAWMGKLNLQQQELNLMKRTLEEGRAELRKQQAEMEDVKSLYKILKRDRRLLNPTHGPAKSSVNACKIC